MKKTKILSLLLIAAIVVAVCVFELPTQADAATSGYYTYEVTNGDVIITDCDESISGDITIPSTLGGYPVTSIGPNAFQYCADMTSLTIPGGVISVESYAFYGCDNLATIVIPNSVTNIGSFVFTDCDKLQFTVYGNAKYLGNNSNPYVYLHQVTSTDITSVNIPNGVKVIATRAFEACCNLTNVSIPNGVISIGASAFAHCSSLTSVTIPYGVTSVESYTFRYCSNLTSITIPNSVNQIGNFAFDSCSSLTSITLPDSITVIGGSAFQHCFSLTSITIPNSVTSIGHSAFLACRGLTSVTLSDNVTSIERGTFSGCSQLTSVVIPKRVKRISQYAFESCSKLTNITIPNSVTMIGTATFSGCSMLSNVYYGGTTAQWQSIQFYSQNEPLTGATIYYTYFCETGHDFDEDSVCVNCSIIGGECGLDLVWTLEENTLTISGDGAMPNWKFSSDTPWAQQCSKIQSVVLENNVANIGDHAFADCYKLSSVSMGNGVTSIGSNAFAYCSSLTNIPIGNSVTNIGMGAFSFCSGLTNISIGNSVTSIDHIAFLSCPNLISVSIGDSVTSVGDYTFLDCSSLISVSIGKNVASIGENAFLECPALEKIIIYSRNCDFNEDCGFNNNQTIYGFSGSTAETLAGNIGAEFVVMFAAEITAQPQSIAVGDGATVTASVSATGDGLTYTWYYKNVGCTSFNKSSVKKATYSTTMNSTVDGRQVYCVVKDKYGNSVKSNTVTLTMKQTAKITTQPTGVTAANGKAAKVTVAATGDDLTYTWYYKNAGATSFSKSSVAKATYAVTMDANVKGRQVYCVVKDKYGNSVKSNTVTLSMGKTLKITTQPKSVNVTKGYAAKVTVAATGDGLTYTWYYKNAGASSFSKSSVTKATYGVTMDAKVNGRQVYCVVKDRYGISVKSSTVTLSMKQTAKITTQPKSVTVAKGYAAKVTVVATGDGLTYTWYYKNAGASSFSKSSVTKATYGVTMDAKVNGRQVYCVVKDRYGNSVKSSTVTLSMKQTAKITTQPTSVTVSKGSAAKVTVVASGDGLTYTWYYKNAGASSFSKSSVAKATYGVIMDAKVNGRQVYCVVADKYGNTVKSSTVTLKMK